MSISTWCFLLLLKREMAGAKLASVLKQMKGSVTEIPSAGRAKTLLLSCNWTNWSAFLHICEEVDGHKNVPKSIFRKGISTFLLHSGDLMRMRFIKGMFEQTATQAHCKGGDQPPWKWGRGHPVLLSSVWQHFCAENTKITLLWIPAVCCHAEMLP